MHIERLGDGSVKLVQALVQLTTSRATRDWWTMYESRAAALASLRAVTLVYRVHVDATGRGCITISATVDESDEQALRRLVGGFTWLEGLAAGSVTLPDNAEAFLGAAESYPRSRYRLLSPQLSTSNRAWLAQCSRLLPSVGTLLDEALYLSHAFGYQVTSAAFRVEKELLRRAGHNLLRLRQSTGISARLISAQAEILASLRSASWLIEEMAATDEDPDAQKWLSSRLNTVMRKTAIQAGLPEPTFTPTNYADEEISLLLHESVTDPELWLADDLLCSQVGNEYFIKDVFALRPSVASLNQPTPDLPDDAERQVVPNPPPPSPGSAQIFISYSRTDTQKIVPLIELMLKDGLSVWYDAHIRAGDDWVDVLEEKIQGAMAIIAFMSRRSAASKYCRREIMFADSIGKIIIPVLLEDVHLEKGLGFTLHSTQMIKSTSDGFEVTLLGRLRSL